MSYLIVRQRERISELEDMLSESNDRNQSLEEALKKVSSYVERLKARVEFLEKLNKMHSKMLLGYWKNYEKKKQ